MLNIGLYLIPDVSTAGSVFFLKPPNCNVSVIAAGRQEAGLLWVPGHAVHILAVSLLHLSSQREHRLVCMGREILLKHSYAIVTTGSC